MKDFIRRNKKMIKIIINILVVIIAVIGVVAGLLIGYLPIKAGVAMGMLMIFATSGLNFCLIGLKDYFYEEGIW